MVITTSAVRTASAGEPAMFASWENGSHLLVVRFQRVIEKPALRRFRTMGAPIRPIPRKAICTGSAVIITAPVHWASTPGDESTEFGQLYKEKRHQPSPVVAFQVIR